jgi:hypothetical protein
MQLSVPDLKPAEERLALSNDGLIEIPIAQQAGLAATAKRIAVRAAAAGAPRKIHRNNNHEHEY